MAKVAMRPIKTMQIYLDPSVEQMEEAERPPHAPRLELTAVGTDAEGYPMVDVACYNGDLVHSGYVKPKNTLSCDKFVAKSVAKEPSLVAVQIDKALTVIAGVIEKLRDQPPPEPTEEEIARRAEEAERRRQEAEKERQRQRDELWANVKTLAEDPRLFALISAAMSTMIVGERRTRSIVYLGVTGRLLKKPPCIVIKGPPAGGKNHVVNTVLALMPGDEEAVHDFTSMSDRYLIYSDDDYKYKTIFLAEADALKDDGMLAYLVRSLVSEGKLTHKTVIEMTGVPFRKEGPTGLLTTTARGGLEEQLETRMVTLHINESERQTRAVMQFEGRQAAGLQTSGLDPTPFIQLQQWLAMLDVHDAIVPYGETLARLIPPFALRARRDFPQILGMIKASALLHWAQREKVEDLGLPIANLDDYCIVYDLMRPIFAVAQAEGVTPRQRAAWTAVRNFRRAMTFGQLGTALGISRQSAQRLATPLLEKGYLANPNAALKGYAAVLEVGDELPRERDGLPEPALLCVAIEDPDSLPPDLLAPLEDEETESEGQGSEEHDITI